ncbi:MAG: sterol desaturase family protein [Burkholderiaceae bacterium]
MNLLIALLAIATATIFVAFVSTRTLERISDEHFGLLSWLGLPAAIEFVAGFLLLDLSFYYWHRANHTIGFLWRFHSVHHTDPDLDVSTAYRFHFGEIALSAGFRVAQIAAIGVSPLTFAIYELVFHANTLFQHSNIGLPIAAERRLQRLLVTPRMHGIHHSEVQRENSSNFSVVFPWWDRLHATLRLNIPQSLIVIGLPAYLTDADNSIATALAMPFRRQRPYWRKPDGRVPERMPTDVQGPQTAMEA